ncbi:hypothetical protein [Streptomyces chromofuscus]|uniref:Uncharacterized protein n=1 Tax=Streptomyces chromofuscus TaxID=42881 RepID=A0A7M2T1T1_STRCW|nr:hypothetical protein [Streptomyces chromofuscus]QOV42556.1 hypothetical protein IPT68_22370 [Streptomyces chromofuscus]GGT30571.1 hypothetical protein GCM10010254_58900 [Streptomyces chromofuscus]
MTTEYRAAAETIRDAEEVRDALASALERAGLTLPSLRLDPNTYADADPRPLVELGRCSPSLARQLTAVIEKGIAR